jgi:hypothetical protein
VFVCQSCGHLCTATWSARASRLLLACKFLLFDVPLAGWMEIPIPALAVAADKEQLALIFHATSVYTSYPVTPDCVLPTFPCCKGYLGWLLPLLTLPWHCGTICSLCTLVSFHVNTWLLNDLLSYLGSVTIDYSGKKR